MGHSGYGEWEKSVAHRPRVAQCVSGLDECLSGARLFADAGRQSDAERAPALVAARQRPYSSTWWRMPGRIRWCSAATCPGTVSTITPAPSCSPISRTRRDTNFAPQCRALARTTHRLGAADGNETTEGGTGPLGRRNPARLGAAEFGEGRDRFRRPRLQDARGVGDPCRRCGRGLAVRRQSHLERQPGRRAALPRHRPHRQRHR